MRVVSKWAINEGEPGWDPNVDVDQNGNIGLSDIMIIVRVWAADCVGGGLIFELNDQITFDVSYRYYSLGEIKPTATSLATEFSASQVLFALRVFEPFRALRR